MTLTLGSLFSGIGALDLGLERALGARTVFQVERNPFCLDVLSRHWPAVPRITDVADYLAWSGGDVTVLCGGIPCQPHSLAGARQGDQDARWLWPEMLRWVAATHPVVVVLENVLGLLTSSGGGVFASILLDLDALGYDVRWRVVSAEACGAPHSRRRTFVTARLRTAPAFPLPAPDPAWGHPGWPSGPREPQRAYEPARVIARCVNRKLRLGALGNAVVPQAAYRVGLEVRDALTTPWEPGEGPVLAPLSGKAPAWPKHGEMIGGRVRTTPAWPGRVTDPLDLWPTPRASESEMRTYAPCPTHGVSHGRQLQAEVIALDGDPTAPAPGQRRPEIGALNPAWVECLMGLPLGWTEGTRDHLR